MFKKSLGYILTTRQKKYWFVEDHRGGFRVKKMCKVLTLSKSGYYAWRMHIQSKRQKDNELLLGHIQAVHRQSRGTYIPTDEGWLWRHLIFRLDKEAMVMILAWIEREGLRQGIKCPAISIIRECTRDYR